jgi:TolA-binding protein
MAKKSKSPFRGGHKHIKQEDAFTRTIEKVYEYYVKAPFQAIITTLAVIGIIVVAAILIAKWTGKGMKAPPKDAALALLTAQQLMETSPEAAEDTLRQIISRYPRTQPGKKAHYYLGQTLFYQGRDEEALTEFEEFEKTYPVKKSFLRPASLYAQGNCLEEMQKFEDAITRYLELPEKYEESSFVPFAKLGAGRCMLILKQYDRAEALYNQMLEEYSTVDYPIIHATVEGELGRIYALRNIF